MPGRTPTRHCTVNIVRELVQPAGARRVQIGWYVHDWAGELIRARISTRLIAEEDEPGKRVTLVVTSQGSSAD